MILANHGGNGGSNHVIRNVDQEALAQMIGTTRSRVNFFMNKFRRLHYVDYDGDSVAVYRSLSNVVLYDDGFGESHDGMSVAC